MSNFSGGGGVSRYACILDQKASGDGGTFTAGAYRERDLNTIQSDVTGMITSLVANQFTLPAGSYAIRASAEAFNVNSHQAILRNITNSTALIIGTSMYAINSSNNHSLISGGFVLAVPTTLAIWHQCLTTISGNGFGVASAFADNVYTIVELWKLS